MTMQPDVPHDEMLASDADRERAAARLRQATVEGRLTLEEFSTRMDSALSARTRGELATLTRDIATTSRALASPATTTRITAILSENKRSGRWRAEGHVNVVAVMGSCKVDLRDAEIVGDEIVINLRSVMADVKIYVPKGMQVIMEDVSIMASTKDERVGDMTLPDAPVVRVQGFGVMSSVEVRNEDPHPLGAIGEFGERMLRDFHKSHTSQRHDRSRD